MEDFSIKKYPRTPHLQGSRLQPGDEDLSQVSFSEIKDRNIVIEEKIDGANSAISFSKDGELLLQSRGHYLTGGFRERHYNLLKQWATVHQEKFFDVLGERYIMYGEWMYAKHAIFYDALPSYFMEFDIYDREKQIYLDTPSRRKLTSQMPVCSVPVLATGRFKNQSDVIKYIGKSNYITDNHIETLRKIAIQNKLDPDRQCAETDSSTTMEGLYIKLEEDGEVKGRYKYVRASFLQCILQSETHWLNRPILPNQLAIPFEDMFKV